MSTFDHVTPLTREAVPEEAPAGWRWVELKKVARLESGHTPSRSRPDWWGGDIPWIALPDIRALDGKVAMTTTENTNPRGIANSAARVLPKDTVVLSRTASVGFVTVMGRPMATSQDFANWVCGPDLHPEFLMYLLMASRAYIRSLASGAVHKTVYMPDLDAFQVCIPSVGRQRQIATHLSQRMSTLATLSDLSSQRSASAEKLQGALLREAFRRQVPLTVGAERVEPPDGWRWRELATLAKHESGHTPSRSRPAFWGGNIPWIALPDIRAMDGKVAMATKEGITPAGVANSAARVLPTGTVVMCRDASVGLVTIMGREMATSQHFANWVCGPDLHPEFLMYLLMASRGYIAGLASGSLIKTVYRQISDAFVVCVPPLRQQVRLAERLRHQLALADAIVEGVRSEQQTIDHLPNVTLREAFHADGDG